MVPAATCEPTAKTSADKRAILIVVHPGSACGSADFNLGKKQARSCRHDLRYDILRWRESLLVIDGELSAELPRWPVFNASIRRALRAAADRGQLASRVDGDDPTHGRAALRFFNSHQLEPKTWRVELTGAWYDPTDDHGCVNDVRKALEQAGFDCRIRGSAVAELPED